MKPDADIHILGTGISAGAHATREAEAVLRRCNEVLYVDNGVATLAWLQSLCPRVTPLFQVAYTADRPRLEAYDQMAARVIDAAMTHPPVAFAMQGHPLVYSYAPFLIRDMAALLGLSVRSLPGISSLDCLLAELWLDPCVHGLQMYECTDLLLRRRPLQPDVPLLLWQVGNVETRLHTTRRSLPERFDRLVSYLRQTYPDDHPVVLYFAPPHPLAPTTIQPVPLAELPAQADALHPGVTLLLPPVAPRPIADAELAGQVDDPAHLARLVR